MAVEFIASVNRGILVWRSCARRKMKDVDLIAGEGKEGKERTAAVYTGRVASWSS
jgi:hypothetical protein